MANSANGPGTEGSPLVSVVVPAYNCGRYVGETLASLRAQTYDNWECVVVDDGSTDDTRAAVDRHRLEDDRIRYIYQKNRGPGAARNRGIRQSTGVYLQFLDADDALAPRKLEEHVSYLEQHPEVDIVYGDMNYFGGVVGWFPPATPSGDDVLPALVSANITGIHAALSRREPAVFFDEELRGPEDWFYWICCALAGKRFEYVPGVLARTRLVANSLSQNSLPMNAGRLRVRLKLAALLKERALLELNRRLIREEEKGLMGMLAGGRDLLRIGRITRQAKWFRYALTMPLRHHARRLVNRG